MAGNRAIQVVLARAKISLDRYPSTPITFEREDGTTGTKPSYGIDEVVSEVYSQIDADVVRELMCESSGEGIFDGLRKLMTNDESLTPRMIRATFIKDIIRQAIMADDNLHGRVLERFLDCAPAT